VLDHYNIQELMPLVKDFDEIIKNFQNKVNDLFKGKFDQD
jgi:hypothetical protein